MLRGNNNGECPHKPRGWWCPVCHMPIAFLLGMCFANLIAACGGLPDTPRQTAKDAFDKVLLHCRQLEAAAPAVEGILQAGEQLEQLENDAQESGVDEGTDVEDSVDVELDVPDPVPVASPLPDAGPPDGGPEP